MKKFDAKRLTVLERQQGFLDEYKTLSLKWGVDFRPAYQIIDTFATEALAIEALKVTEDEKKEPLEISKE